MKNIIIFILILTATHAFYGQAVYNGSTKHTFTTNHGTIDIGPFNSSYGHIYTDRPKFIFNKPIYTTANTFSSYNNDLIFQTEGNTRLVINDDTGYVGIGTTNPQEKLQIGNTFTFHDSGNKVIGFLYKPSGGLDLDATKYSAEIRFDPTGGNLRFGTSSSLTNNPSGHLAITKDGNVGIGTDSPTAKLEVLGMANNAAIILGEENFIAFKRASGHLVYGVGHENGEFTIGRSENLGSTAGTPINIATGAYTIRFSQGTTERMRIADNGNVGIGTTNPGSYSLAVKGKIRAEEIKVDTGWADYVFKEDYNLPTLEEVEKHINEKGHLINIPSAEEVEANGIQLGEMNKLLLEKIEELTLYTLAQQKLLDKKDLEILLLEERLTKIEQLINQK